MTKLTQKNVRAELAQGAPGESEDQYYAPPLQQLWDSLNSWTPEYTANRPRLAALHTQLMWRVADARAIAVELDKLVGEANRE